MATDCPLTGRLWQVLVQGWLLTEDNLNSFLDCVATKLNSIEDKFADVTAMANDQLEAQRVTDRGYHRLRGWLGSCVLVLAVSPVCQL